MQSLFTSSPSPRRLSLRRVHRLVYSPRRALRLVDPIVSRHHLRLSGLPAALAGFRIVQLSDIHFGMFLHQQAVERMVELANGFHADLIAVTGDFVTTSRQFIDPVGEMMGRLRASQGVYAVLGNHDFRAGADRVTWALRQHGVEVLRNTSLILWPRGAAIRVAGIDDSRHHPDLRAALALTERRSTNRRSGDRDVEPTARPGSGALRPAGGRLFTVLLAHNPIALEDAAANDVDLVLSGHTHGGQIRLRLAEPFYERYLPKGFLAAGNTLMYVNRGLGKVIIPMRLNCPPELAVFDLQPTNAPKS
jgi:predicted MPP superfamily phosphohydrolase